MSTVRPLVQLLASLVAVLTAFAGAQPVTTIERPEFDVRFGYPSAWVAEPAPANGDAVALNFTPPGDAGLVVVVLARLSAEDRVALAGVGPEGVWDAWDGFSAGMQGVRAERDGVRTVAGIQAGVIEFVGEGITGSLIGVFGDVTSVTIVSIAVDGRDAVVREGLETILASFSFLSSAGAGSGNPLAPLVGNALAPPTANASTLPTAEPSYREPFTGTDPHSAFGGVLDVGSDGTWTGSLTGVAYRLSNAVDGGAVRYYYLMSLPGEGGPLAQGTIGVTVGMAPGGGGISAAGLVFDFDPSNGSYLAFALTSTGYIVLQRGSAGLDLLVDEDLDSLRPDGRNRLELRAVGTSVEVIVNGERAATLNGERPFDGGVGIVAIGAGTFEFQDFHYLRP